MCIKFGNTRRAVQIFLFAILLQLLFDRAEPLTDIPNCVFEDTANITGSIKYENGSYLYEGVLLTPDLVAIYDYEELFDGARTPVAPHTRGCICREKACVKFCCHPKELKKDEMRECARELSEELDYSPYVNVTFKNGSRLSVHILEDFMVQQGIPCHNAYTLIPQEDIRDSWELFENGTLLRSFDMTYLSRRDYCLSPHKLNDTYILNPMNCLTTYVAPITLTINSIAMLISIPFLLLTILVYSFIPQLRNLHGKCLICYLICLSVGYTVLVLITLLDSQFSDHVCSLIGYSGYFAFMAGFFWLSVISFDLWNSFRGTKCNVERFMQNKRFYIYSLYAWGIPIVLTGLVILIQFSDLDENLKPGIGTDYCWINTHSWSAMIYFYAPILVLILFNSTMFILTFMKIYQVKKEMERFVAREESTRNLALQKDNFGLFLRLFVVMGVTWLLEVASYLVGSLKIWSVLFYLPDLCNAAQGIIIFILFVFRRSVKILIRKRLDSTNDGNRQLNSKFKESSRNVSNVHCSSASLMKVH